MESRIIVALDELGLEECLSLVSKIGKRVYAIKIHNLFDMHGPIIVQSLRDVGAQRIWLDLKLHDIPNTVRLRAKALAASGPDIVSVHASGGIAMMQAARESFRGEVFAVTALTSLGEYEAQAIYGRTPQGMVLSLADLAQRAGVTGIVCSSKEAAMIAGHPELGGLKIVVPGVRSPGRDVGDQQRVDTPSHAAAAGATHIVIGRQITQAEDPVAELDAIESGLDQLAKI